MTYIAEIGQTGQLLWHALASRRITLCGWDAPRSTRETTVLSDAMRARLCPACRMVQDATEEERRGGRVRR